MRKTMLLLVTILLLSGCTYQQNDISTAQETPLVQDDVSSEAGLEPFADVRGGINISRTLVLATKDYNADDIYTYEFNEYTLFEENAELQQTIMERGKNPGLGIRALHEQGITGKGISVAIIDQNLFLEPPEFSDKIVQYYECGYDFSQVDGSMHGPAVVSILAGETCGVAPDVSVYYAAAPSWTRDAAYYADGLSWIVNVNKGLGDNEKIRVVSVSAAPSGPGSPFDKNLELWDEAVAQAQAAGILVIDCRSDPNTGFVRHGFYDPDDPENIEKARNGWSYSGQTSPTTEGSISVPGDFRTTVEQYRKGDYFFRYGGNGGLSWSIPYAAGVLALGWQVNPELTAVEMRQLLIDSAYMNEFDELIIYPAAFIKMVEATR